jgi:hypothetical protein
VQDNLQFLAAAIAGAGGPEYASACDRDGAGYRGITCAFLFRKDRARLLPIEAGHQVFGEVPAFGYPGESLPGNTDVSNPKAFNAVLPPDVDLSTGIADTNVFPRAPQVALFEVARSFDGSSQPVRLYIINNHYVSRPNERVGQRIEGSIYNGLLVEAIKSKDPDAHIVVGGDLNVFPRPDDPMPDSPLDQLGPLYEQGLFNLYDDILQHHPAGAYTYVYRGQAGTLDQLLVSASLRQRLHRTWVCHVNADWPDGVRDESPFGVSDHDPVIAAFRLP